MGVRFLGIGRAGANAKAEKNRAREQFNESLGGYNDVLAQLKRRGEDADLRAGMSVRDLFGDSIDRNTDSIRSTANATKQNLSRLGNARGDDPTGATNAALNEVDENANANISDIIQFFTNRATSVTDQARSRGDQLANLMLSGQGNLLNLSNQRLQNAILRDLQRRQANKQLGLGLLNTITSAGTKILAPGSSGGG